MKCRSALAVTLECFPLGVRGPQPSVCVGRGRADTPSCHVPMSGDVCTWTLADGLYRWDDASRESSERPGHALRRACPPYGQGLALAMWPEACPPARQTLGRAGALSLRSPWQSLGLSNFGFVSVSGIFSLSTLKSFF